MSDLIMQASGGLVGTLVLVAPLQDLPRFMRVVTDHTSRPGGLLSKRARMDFGRGQVWGFVTRTAEGYGRDAKHPRAVLFVEDGDQVVYRYTPAPEGTVTCDDVAAYPGRLAYLVLDGKTFKTVPVPQADIDAVVASQQPRPMAREGAPW